MEMQLSKARLRPWRAGDEAALARHANNRNVSRNLRDIFPYPYTFPDAEWWIATGSVSQPNANFAVEVNGEASGGIGLRQEDDVYRRGLKIGYWLGEACWGRGIATEATIAVTRYGFATFDVVRIGAGVFSRNAASARVLEKAGYHFEGRLRSAVTKDGVIGDALVYGCLRDDWLAAHPV